MSEIVPEFKTGDKDGLITMKIRGNGNIARQWSEIKSKVLTPAGSGTPGKSRTCAHAFGGRCSIH